MENGKIFQDDINLKHFKKEQLTLMVGNKNRTGLLVEDGYVDKDVISNRHITKGKFKMCCGHFTGKNLMANIVYIISNSIFSDINGHLIKRNKI